MTKGDASSPKGYRSADYVKGKCADRWRFQREDEVSTNVCKYKLGFQTSKARILNNFFDCLRFLNKATCPGRSSSIKQLKPGNVFRRMKVKESKTSS